MTRDPLIYAECVARFRAVCRVAERRNRPDWGAVLAELPQDASAALVSTAEMLGRGDRFDEAG